MTKRRGWPFALLGLVVLTGFAPIAAEGIPGIWRTAHTLMKDNRVIRDRLHPRNNRDHADYAFLNAVGAVWSADITMAAVGYSASTGFLIDRWIDDDIVGIHDVHVREHMTSIDEKPG